MRVTLVQPQGMQPLVNGEAAKCGQAVLAQNVRERDHALQVTGQPVTRGSIAPGARLLAMVDGHSVTCSGSVVSVDGQRVTTVEGSVVGAHAIGPMMVIVASGGVTYLSPTADGWEVMNPSDAVPELAFTANMSTLSTTIASYEFANPYRQWRAPLSDVDTASLAGLLRTAWYGLAADIRALGRHASPMLVRWAVRLQDDTYLWMSDPVRVGDDTLANADRIAAQVDSGNDGFTGTQSTTLPMRHYALDISVTRGIAEQWLPLVKSVDVLATDEATLLSAGHVLDYRCLTRTTGPREYVLEMALSRRGASAISQQLAASPWRLVATAPASMTLQGSDFVAPVVGMTWSASQCAALAAPLQASDVVCSTASGGRLYCCTRAGDVIVTPAGNALVEQHRRSVLGAVPLAMAVVTRPLYSGGFGRYPVYVFSDDGIYAIPQSAGGVLGEARLVDRTVIAASVAPVEAGRDIWLLSRHGHLCRLSGSALTVCQPDVTYRSLAWCNAHRELWMLPASGYPVVMMERGTMSVRTVAAAQLYSDARHALAVTRDGEVLDLEREGAAMMPVAWTTHPFELNPLMARTVKRVVWHLSSDEVSLSLRVVGQRGIMAQDIAVSITQVAGAVSQPLAAPTPAWRARTLRLSLTGEARTGTLLMKTLIYSHQ